MKRVLVVIVSLVMLISTFTACSSPSSTPTTSSTPSVAPATKITIAGNWGGTGTKPQPNGIVVMDANQRFNVELEFWDVGAMLQDEQFNLELASGKIPDVFFGNKYRDWMVQGVVRPITMDQITSNLPNVWPLVTTYDPRGLSFVDLTSDEKIYGIPRLSALGAASAYVRVYRQDWLDKLNLKLPTTLTEMEAVMDAFTNGDPDGNGKNDTTGINTEAWKFYLSDVFGAFGTMPDQWLPQSDGSLVWSDTTVEYKEALKLLASWYKKGYINSEFMTDSWDTFIAKFVNSKVGSYSINSRWVLPTESDTPTALLLKNNKDAKLSYADAVKGPDGKSGTYYYGPSAGWALCFGKDTSDEVVAKYLKMVDYYYGDPAGLMTLYGGIEGKTYSVVDGRVNSTLLMEQQVKEGIGETFIFPLQPASVFTVKYGNVGGIERDFMTKALEQPIIMSSILGLTLKKSNEAGIGKDVPTICDAFYYDGITGKIDIDASWDEYLKKLDAAGLKELTIEANQINSEINK